MRIYNLSQSDVTLIVDVDHNGEGSADGDIIYDGVVDINDIFETPGLETGSYVLVNATDPNETLQVVVVD